MHLFSGSSSLFNHLNWNKAERPEPFRCRLRPKVAGCVHLKDFIEATEGILKCHNILQRTKILTTQMLYLNRWSFPPNLQTCRCYLSQREVLTWLIETSGLWMLIKFCKEEKVCASSHITLFARQTVSNCEESMKAHFNFKAHLCFVHLQHLAANDDSPLEHTVVFVLPVNPVVSLLQCQCLQRGLRSQRDPSIRPGGMPL